ncbi:MAG TPA: acyl carrier protein [Bacteriovoracaceae bacterium]|nr:acyl carrier protein [Bacteriovoracaceae bacterium]
MNKNEIMDKLAQTIRTVFENPSIEIKEATSANDVDEWDSLAHISLIEEVEKAFKVKFALGELMKLQNVGQMADLILKKSAK